MDRINEGTTGYLNLTFYDKDGNAQSPTVAYYSIRCLTTGSTVVDVTSIPPASTIEIKIKPDENYIIDPGNDTELRRVLVQAEYGAQDAVTDIYEYHVDKILPTY